MGKVANGKAEDVLLSINFHRIAVVTVSLPAVSLFYCFVTGIIFRFDEVNETVCKAQNVVPSISAVTGITPQAYFWRICIALHCTPRFAVGVIYYNYYKAKICLVSEKYRTLFLQLLRLNFWLYTIENSCLVGVTYISNKENYPVHEKIFVLFMVMCCSYMLLNTIIFKWTRTEHWTDIEIRSYKIKKYMWVAIMSATMGLLFFFVRHRVFCIPYAFSYFSACEYVIAYTNMAYHLSAYYEFQDKFFIMAGLKLDSASCNGTTTTNHIQNSYRVVNSRKEE